MIFEVENGIWFDSEKLYIVNGKEKLERYKEKYDEYSYPREGKSEMAYPVITFLSTTRCNLKCTYCYASQGTYNNVSRTSSFTCENYIRAYECIRKEYGGIKGICFFGGEPLLNFLEIKKYVEYLYRHENKSEIPFLSIGSNGTIMNQEILDFISKYKIAFGTSLDGTKQYNDICRVGDSISSVHDKVTNTLSILGNKGINTSLQFTFNRAHIENYRHGDVVRWVKEFEKLPISYYEIIAATTDYEPNRIDLSNSDIMHNFKSMCMELADYSLSNLISKKTTIMSVIFAYIIASISQRRVAGHCGAGRNITISPDLIVYPCHVIAGDVCNGVKCEEGFKSKIESNDKFQEIINMNRIGVRKCQECIAKNLCSVFCKGMCGSNPIEPPEERCLMMKIFVYQTILFMANDYQNHKDAVASSIKNVISSHKITT